MMLPLELLRKLGSGIRPGDAPRVRADSGHTEIDFRALVESARAGRLRSNQPIHWSGDTAPDGDVQNLIVLALDRAEAAGAQRLLIVKGDSLWSADLTTRRISPLQTDANGIFGLGIEAILVIRSEEHSAHGLERLEQIESGTASAKQSHAPGLGWVSNRSLEALLGAAQARIDHE